MKKILALFIATQIFSSCVTNTSSNPIKPNPTGKAGEVIVVINDSKWNTEVGDTIFYTLSYPFPDLPQDEPFFDVVHIPHSSFQSIFKTHRNIIFINIGVEHQEPKITKTQDKWANYQIIYNFYAPDDTSMIKLWGENYEQIKRNIFNADLTRFQSSFKNYQNTEAIAKIKNLYNISMEIPSEFNLDELKDNFYWISKETNTTSQGIFIYTYPYTDSNTFTLDYIVAKRDEYLKKYVPGPNDNTYMQTEKQVPMQTEEITLNGNYGFVLRGLWYTENYFMGGPFVSISVLDEKNNRVITVEAYVYAGKQDKKLYLWQTEAVIKTMKIL